MPLTTILANAQRIKLVNLLDANVTCKEILSATQLDNSSLRFALFELRTYLFVSSLFSKLKQSSRLFSAVEKQWWEIK